MANSPLARWPTPAASTSADPAQAPPAAAEGAARSTGERPERASSDQPAAPETDDREAVLAGDINRDGVVDVFDYGDLTAAFGSADDRADIDGSGEVDEVDLAILRKNLGKTAETGGLMIQPNADRSPGVVGDVNGDGAVDVRDFAELASRFGTDDQAADLFADGVVDEIDLAVLKREFGRTA